MASDKEKIALQARHIDAARLLPLNQRGKLYNAIIEYTLTGVAPELKGAAAGLFMLIRAEIDCGKKMSEVRRDAVGARWGKTDDTTDDTNGDFVNTNVDTNIDTNGDFVNTNVDTNIDTNGDFVNTNVDTNIDTPENGAIYVLNNNNNIYALKDLKDLKDKNIKDKNIYTPKPPRHKHGEFGWITLTDEQYQKLIAEHGTDKIARYITYVDEYVQSTGNKNKYKDFHLVMRKAIREGWADKPKTDAERRREILEDPIEWRIKP